MNSTAGLFPETVHATVRDLPAGEFPHWTRTTLAGAKALISYQINGAEHDRRTNAGLGALTSPDLLRQLISLPVGERVRTRAVPSSDRRRLLDAGVVAEDGAELTRLAVPPVEAGIALVAARSWRSGLEMAGRFAPFCARAMVLDHIPSAVDHLRMEADFYGIGVIVTDRQEDSSSLLVPPDPFVRQRWTVGGWLFVERLYASICRATEPTSSRRWSV